MREQTEETKERRDERREREGEKEKEKTSWTLYNIPGANPEALFGWW